MLNTENYLCSHCECYWGRNFAKIHILKQVLFLLAYYDCLMCWSYIYIYIYIYEVCLALMRLLFLLYDIENSYRKAFFGGNCFLIGEGKINFLGGWDKTEHKSSCSDLYIIYSKWFYLLSINIPSLLFYSNHLFLSKYYEKIIY